MKKTITLLSTLFLTVTLFAKGSNLLLKENYSTSKINSIDISLSSEKVTIKPIYGDEISVEIYTNNRSRLPVVETHDNELCISSARYKKFGIADYCNVDIYIPFDFNFEEVIVKTSSGEISLTDVNADTCSLRASSGSIEISNINATELQINSSSGRIRVNRFTGEYIYTEASSGSIRASGIICDYFDAKASSGSVEYVLKTAPKAASAIRTSSGSITLSIPEDTGFDIICSSSSGSFKDHHSGNRFSPRGDFRNSYYGGGPEISLRSSSGSITLEN